MAAPNIVNVTSIVPHTVTLTPADTARNLLVSAPASGSAHKVNELVVSNIDGTSAYSCTVELRLADGTTYRAIASTIAVPANSSLIIIDKSSMVYLLDTSVTGEASTIYVTSSTASKLTYSCSYETIT
jgi:transcriptional antiterminator Rof (Rho-off)